MKLLLTWEVVKVTWLQARRAHRKSAHRNHECGWIVPPPQQQAETVLAGVAAVTKWQGSLNWPQRTRVGNGRLRNDI